MSLEVLKGVCSDFFQKFQGKLVINACEIGGLNWQFQICSLFCLGQCTCNLMHFHDACCLAHDLNTTQINVYKQFNSFKISIKQCYGYSHLSMQIPRDFRTSELLGSFNQRWRLNFDKFEPPLCGFQFFSLKLIVKSCCDLFNMFTRGLHGWVILSQDARIESRLQWISSNGGWINFDLSETQGMCTFWQKNRHLFQLEKSSLLFSQTKTHNEK